MRKDRDHWIDEVLSSTESKKELPISDALRLRLNEIRTEDQVMSLVIPMRVVYLALASFALLITMNLLAINAGKKSETQESELYTAYFSYMNQL
jgi:hypothetical protein